ncbi:MAG: sigma 54-interacting transcriptional regulator [Desulfuromonadaceae bacterium]|nr:sigma 54-interacting transcriptional regulator [Desulfuromonadaceae bacterium]MDD2847368.1 sigma 54-interacting transcriptional regulator [Desulfuromonadaceae bacterium]MDD4131519.1 sigma 54-interacting transcriptional regulator [Desulfuromonadaceae bacterium]
MNIHADIPSVYQTILENMGEGIIFADADGTLTFINHTAEKIRGIAAANFIGRNLLSIHTPASAERIGKLLESLRNGSIRHARRVIDVKGKCFENSYYPIRQPDGSFMGTLLISRDITEKQRLREENQALRENMNLGVLFDGFVGVSAAILKLFRTINVVAPLDSTILITGESGTGKELVAVALHQGSKRCHKPMIKVNCAALPEHLVESQLFGHERGAFTGAVSTHRGKFEQAHGGTIFLDEIGDLPLAAQAKLLRVLQNRTVVRLGSEREILVDVRIIAATNKDLHALVAAGQFREDLYYRLLVIAVHIPALRERREDIIPLAEHFVRTFAEKMARPIQGLCEETAHALMTYNYPGNVRELEHAIERCVALCTDTCLSPDDLPAAFMADLRDDSILPPASHHTKATDSLSLAMGGYERQIIMDALVKTGGRKADAARLLNISRKTLWEKLKRLEQA